MKAQYRQSSGVFVFHNENPKGSLSSGDCVVRAIAKATGKDWHEVYSKLCQAGALIADLPDAKPTFTRYLKDLGYPMSKQLRKADSTKYTVEEFANKLNTGTYVILLAKHLSVIVEGKIYDTWNCKDKTVGNFWRIK